MIGNTDFLNAFIAVWQAVKPSLIEKFTLFNPYRLVKEILLPKPCQKVKTIAERHEVYEVYKIKTSSLGVLNMLNKVLLPIMEWIWRLVYLNLIWILFCLPVITIIPSTFALIAVANKWFKEDKDIATFTTFRQQFTLYFWKSHQYGLTFIITGFFLYLDLMIVSNQVGSLFLIMRYVIILIIILLVITMIYTVPVHMNYQFSVLKTLLFALNLGLRQPVTTIMVLIGIMLSILTFMFFTGIGILFIGSLPAFMISKSTHYKISKLITI